MTITGNLVSLHVLAGRSDLIVLAVHANLMGGQFSCDPLTVSIDGHMPGTVGQIASAVAGRNWTAKLIGVDDSQGGIGVRPCESVELTTKED